MFTNYNNIIKTLTLFFLYANFNKTLKKICPERFCITVLNKFN